MSARQKRRLLRTVFVTECTLFAFALAAVAVVVIRLRVDAWGLLAALAVIALFLIQRFESAVRREPLAPAADEEAAAS